jgi:hypothetical protein
MYRTKFGIDWFNTVFFHGYAFILPAIIALAVVFPYPKRSDLFAVLRRFLGGGTPTGRLRESRPERFSRVKETFGLHGKLSSG